MRLLAAFLVLLAIAMLQAGGGHIVSPWGVAPDAVLVAVVAWSLVCGVEEGMVAGMLGGIALGLVSDVPMGVHSFILTVIGFLAGLVQTGPLRARLVVPVLMVVVATVIYHLVIAVMLRLIGSPPAIIPAVIGALAPSVVLNAVLMMLVSWIISQFAAFRGGLRSGY